uniref:hypothetical protein n=1 Tax=Streptomyces sp. CA-136453 TaxID=3240050 RepID=UPI003F49135A
MTDTPAALPPVLSPRDESRVALARSAWHVADRARELIPVDPDVFTGGLLRQALEVAEEAQRLVTAAVIAERERGTTWEQLAQETGSSRQAAHERWFPAVQTWSRLGRRVGGGSPDADTAAEVVAFLDQQYARFDAKRTDAVSAGLEAVRHPAPAPHEEALRARGQQLHARRVELLRDDRRNTAEYERLKSPTTRDGWLRLAANRTASADIDTALAAVYDDLVSAEPALADEHRADAEQHRTFAKQASSYVNHAIERAGEA